MLLHILLALSTKQLVYNFSLVKSELDYTLVFSNNNNHINSSSIALSLSQHLKVGVSIPVAGMIVTL